MDEERPPSRTPGPVDRAFALLQRIVASGQPIGIRELARQSGLSPSTTSRTVGILSDLGMVERTPHGAVRPGPSLNTLTRNAHRWPATIRDRLRPLAFELARTFEENAAIAVDDGDAVLYLASAPLATAVQVPDPAGSSFPFHLTAPGLVAMSSWTEERLEHHVSRPLRSATRFSVTDPQELRDRLAACARDGYAWTDQELDLEVNGLAAPIHRPDGTLLAIATLYGPSYRFSAELRPSLGAEFARHVGHRGAALA